MQTHENFSEYKGFIATFSGPVFQTESRHVDWWAERKDIKLVTSPHRFDHSSVVTRSLSDILAPIVTWSTQLLSHFIAECISAVDQVERIYSKLDGHIFHAWIVIEERDTEVLRQIYSREAEIVRRFDDFEFDFYVIYRAGVDLDEIVSEVDLVYDKSR